MYSTCLFCTQSLERNEALEHFPVGRRLAFDPAKGRLWVVCRRCERWNLTPLEIRWEAIDEAARAYRDAPLKVSTDNVGLAQLSEGLELVRVGAPPRAELTAWRYGDQFGRRRRRHLAIGAAGAAAVAASAVFPVLGVATVGSLLTIAHRSVLMYQQWSDARNPRFVVRGDDGAPIRLTPQNARCAALIPSGAGDWQLKIPYRISKPSAALRMGEAMLAGASAHRALATILPHLNRQGGSGKQIRQATEVIGESGSLDRLLRMASINDEARRTHFKIKEGESNVGALPARIRLALEMALHEDDELRAMEGELRELEQRWRDAEEIAAIADDLTLPPGIGREMDELRLRSGGGEVGSP